VKNVKGTIVSPPTKQPYNVAMRRWLAQSILLGVICLLTSQPIRAQQSRSCAPSKSSIEQSAPDISIAEVAFLGALKMSVADQEAIAASLKQQTGSLDGVVGEAEERVRAAWQNLGYFKVQVSGDARILTSSPVTQRIALSFRIDEGQQYRLGEIRFLNNKAITDVRALRALFPITDGDIFSRGEIAKGLENLRKAYGEVGYITSHLSRTPGSMTKRD
jgi:outer membrane protein assembly factor BamA